MHGGHGPRRGTGKGGFFERHPVFSGKTTSRSLFRKFLRLKGLFGAKKVVNENDPADTTDDTQLKSGIIASLQRWRVEIAPFFSTIVYILVISALSRLFGAAAPWLSKLIIDDVIPSGDYNYLFWVCVTLVLAELIGIILGGYRDYKTRTLSGGFITKIKRRLVRKMHQLPLARIQKLKVGGVVSRLESDTEAMSGFVHQAIMTPFNAILMLIIAMVSMAIVSITLTLSLIVFSLILLLTGYIFFSATRPLRREVRENVSSITGHVAETFGGATVVRAFSREVSEMRGYTVENQFIYRLGLYADSLSIIGHYLVWAIWLGMVGIVWYFGGSDVLAGHLKLGDLLLFVLFIEWFFGPIFMLLGTFSEMQNSLACAERVFDLLAEDTEMPDRPDATAAKKPQKSITFKDLTFRYPDGTLALEQVNFTLPAGKVTALVGSSGAGKSTVANLLMRFYDPSSGAVMIDDTDIRDFELVSYRRLLGLVLQDVFLFDGSVRDNIAYGLPNADLDAIRAAAKIANADEFVMQLPQQYESIIGERGVKLSGGQKQRLALARAVLSNPEILILDEATSSLDSESEALIQDALHAVFKNRTTLVIAHRLSTIMDADQIVVLDKGHVVESGRHNELLAAKGRYAQLYERQMERARQAVQFFTWSDNDSENEEESDDD